MSYHDSWERGMTGRPHLYDRPLYDTSTLFGTVHPLKSIKKKIQINRILRLNNQIHYQIIYPQYGVLT